MIQTFTISGIPHPQGRPRFARMGKFVRAYDPADSRVAKENIRAQIVAQQPVYHGSAPISVTAVFVFPRPKSHYGARGLKAGAPRYHVTRPDTDNCLKGLLDACKGVLWADDTQIVLLAGEKRYGIGTEPPKTTVTITEVIW